jgi:hypothetical protein
MCVEASCFFVCERPNKTSRYVSDWMLKKDVEERERLASFGRVLRCFWARGRGVLVFKQNAGRQM